LFYGVLEYSAPQILPLVLALSTAAWVWLLQWSYRRSCRYFLCPPLFLAVTMPPWLTQP
jgi:hypothetical protein